MQVIRYSDIYTDDSTLRPYQQKAKAEIFESWDDVDNVMFQMPTGTGKTRLFTSIIKDINQYSLKRKEAVKILIIAHRAELIDQISESLVKYCVPHNVIGGSRKKEDSTIAQVTSIKEVALPNKVNRKKLPVHVASIQTLTHPNNLTFAKRLNVQFVIIDEAHHALATTYKKLWNLYPESKKLGVTATPWRMNHQSFTDLFDKLVMSMPIKDFIKQGYLSPYVYYSLRDDSYIQKAINGIALDKFGEYSEASMEEEMDIGKIRAQLLSSYQSLAKGKKGIIYAINRTHAAHIQKEYEGAGYNVVAIDSKTPDSERKAIVEEFKKRNSKIDIIVNVDIFSEGFDCPDIEFIQLARPTRSLVKYLQQVGRGLRITESKGNCIILDNVGMYSRFGLPDARRHWNYHFLGHEVDEEQPRKSFSKGTGRQRFVDMSEGTEDMELIQESDFVEEIPEKVVNEDKSTTFLDWKGLFLVWGVTLGKTTWKEMEEMGYKVEIWEKGPSRLSHVNDIDFWDHEGEGVFTSLYWVYSQFNKVDFPQSWKSNGFSWDLSYDDWMNVFKELNFEFTITKEPTVKNNSFYAECKATSEDKTLNFDLVFGYRRNGTHSFSKGTLYSIHTNFNNKKDDTDKEDLFYDENGISYHKERDVLLRYPNGNNFKTINIPDFISTLGTLVFKDVKASEIIIHDEIEELRDSIFSGCQNLKTLTIKSETPEDIIIDKNAFSDFPVGECVLRVPFDALKEYMKDERFSDFKYITAIEGSRCLKYDEDGTTIIGCDEEDSGNIVIPEGVKEIKKAAFEDNKNIKTIEFPESLLSIGDCAFSGCTGIKQITLNENLEKIGYDAFRNTSLKEVEIPFFVEKIGASAFNCEIKLHSLNSDFVVKDGVLFDFLEEELIIYPSHKTGNHYEVPDAVETIGYFAFEDSSLESISLPDSINHLETNIFQDCNYLKKIIINVTDPETIEIDEGAFEGFNKNQCCVIVPFGSKTKYLEHMMFKDFLSIEEKEDEENDECEEDETEEISEFDQSNNGFKPGSYFYTLKEPVLTESKEFCGSNRNFNCKVVMTSKGFFLELLKGGYYFLSDLVGPYTMGMIWIKNQRGTLKSYNVCFVSKKYNVDKALGHFTEGEYSDILMYRDFKSNETFVIDLKTGKRIK